MPPKTGKGRKAKGNNFERAVIKLLQAAGIDCSRNALTGQTFDMGDILGIPGWTLQLKAYTDVTRGIREGVAGAMTQRLTANTEYGAAIVKKPRGKIEDAYVVMPLWHFIDLMTEQIGNRVALKMMQQQINTLKRAKETQT